MSEGEDEIAGLAADMAALSNPQRLRLLHMLTTPLYAEEIAEHLGVTRQAAARHLLLLQERGFIAALSGRRATGPVTEYAVVPQRLFAMAVSLGGLGRLESSGGPLVRPARPTMRLDAGGPRKEEAVHAVDVPQVLILTGPSAGTSVALAPAGGSWSIGRAKDRDICLDPDPFVSTRHADIRQDVLGHWLADASSANGTFVNFKRLPPGQRVMLRVGDVLGVGHTLLAFQKGNADVAAPQR